MYSKLRRALVAGLSLLTISCGLKTGEAPPPPASPSFKGENYACVGRIPEALDAYVKNQLSEGEIRGFIGCLQRAFVTFSALTRGRDEKIYTPDELRNFLQRNFLRDKYIISDRLMNEFMLIKQILVGGAFDRVTRGELFQLVLVLDDLRDEAIRIKPHLPLLNPSLSREMSEEEKSKNLPERLRKANEAMAAAIRKIGARLEKGSVDYSLDHLNVFLTEFRHFVHWDEHFKSAAPVASWVKFLKNFKIAAVAPFDANIIHPDDWATIFTNMWRWYSVFVHYQLAVKGQAVFEDIGLQNLILLAGEVFDLTRESIQKQPDLTLGFDTIVSMLDSAREIGWLPNSLRSASLRRVVTQLVTRSLGDLRVPIHLRSTRGLTMDALATLSADFYRWARIQADLNVVWAKNAPRPTHTPNLQTRNYINPEIRQQLAGPRSAEYLDFMKVNSLFPPLFKESPDGSLVRMTLAPVSKRASIGVVQNFTNLSYMNLGRTLVSVIFRGYAEDSGNRSSWADGITASELERFSEDIRDFGVDLKLVDWRNCGVGRRSFAEGNLFTFTSDGVPWDFDKTPDVSTDTSKELVTLDPQGKTEDPEVTRERLADKQGGRIDMSEAIQLASFLYSGGTLANDYYNRFAKTCPVGPDDINGLPKISRTCVRERLTEEIMNYDNLPGLRDFLRARSAADAQAYSELMLDTVFTRKNLIEDPLKAWVEMNELSTLAVVMHYMEAVMVRFDKNEDGYLTAPELEHAMPVFSGFIKKFAKEKFAATSIIMNQWTAKGIFLFILTNGRLPDRESKWGLTKDAASMLHLGYIRNAYALDSNDPRKSDIRLDREGLARAFKAIINNLLDEGPEVNKITRECPPDASLELIDKHQAQ